MQEIENLEFQEDLKKFIELMNAQKGNEIERKKVEIMQAKAKSDSRECSIQKASDHLSNQCSEEDQARNQKEVAFECSSNNKTEKFSELHLKISSNNQKNQNLDNSKALLSTTEKSIIRKYEDGYPIFEELKEFLPSTIGRDKLNNFYSVSQMLKYIKMKEWKKMTDMHPYLLEPQCYSKTLISPLRSHLYSKNNNLLRVNISYSIVNRLVDKMLQKEAEDKE